MLGTPKNRSLSWISKPRFMRSFCIYIPFQNPVIPLCWPITLLWFWCLVMVVAWWVWLMATSHCNLVSPLQLDLDGSASLAAWNNSFRQSQEFGTFTTIANYTEQFQVVPPQGKTCSVFCFEIWLQTVGLTISILSLHELQPWIHCSLFSFIDWRSYWICSPVPSDCSYWF